MQQVFDPLLDRGDLGTKQGVHVQQVHVLRVHEQDAGVRVVAADRPTGEAPAATVASSRPRPPVRGRDNEHVHAMTRARFEVGEASVQPLANRLGHHTTHVVEVARGREERQLGGLLIGGQGPAGHEHRPEDGERRAKRMDPHGASGRYGCRAEAGRSKRESSRGTLTSTLSITIFCFSGLFAGPASTR